MFADVRYDAINESIIYYHSDIKSFSLSVDYNLPDDSVSDGFRHFQLFTTLQRFLDNPDVPVCGSTIFVLKKRLCSGAGCPLSIEENNFYSSLAKNQVTFNCILSNHYSQVGSFWNEFVASDETNGIIVTAGQYSYDNDSGFLQVARNIMSVPYSHNLFYADNVNQKTDGNITGMILSPLNVPSYPDKLVNVTLVITTDKFHNLYFQSIHLTLLERTSHKNTSLFFDRSDLLGDTDSIWKTIQLESGTVSNVMMDYQTEYAGNVQIRMYIDKPVPDNWLGPQKIRPYSRQVLNTDPKF